MWLMHARTHTHVCMHAHMHARILIYTCIRAPVHCILQCHYPFCLPCFPLFVPLSHLVPCPCTTVRVSLFFPLPPFPTILRPLSPHPSYLTPQPLCSLYINPHPPFPPLPAPPLPSPPLPSFPFPPLSSLLPSISSLPETWMGLGRCLP